MYANVSHDPSHPVIKHTLAQGVPIEASREMPHDCYSNAIAELAQLFKSSGDLVVPTGDFSFSVFREGMHFADVSVDKEQKYDPLP